MVTANQWTETDQSDQLGSAQSRLRDLVGRNRRVLLIGHAVAPFAHSLVEYGCTLVAMESDSVLAANAVPFCERVLTGEPDENLEYELPGERFDAVVLLDLETLSDPGAVLRSCTALLAPGGRIVASVLNAAHVDVRLQLLRGQLPYGAGSLVDRSALPLYFRDTVEKLFEDLDLDVVQFERIEDAGRHATLGSSMGVPSAVIDAFMADAEALTERFVVVARNQTVPGLDLIEHRLRRLTGLRDEIVQALDGLTTTLAVQTEQLTGLSLAVAANEQHLAGLTSVLSAGVERDQALHDRVHDLAARTEALGEALHAVQEEDGHDEEELAGVAEHLESRLQTALRRGQAALPPDELKQIRYRRVICGLRGALNAAARGSVAAVISRGDDELLRAGDVECWHFPRDEKGGYAGYYPGNSVEVIAHLEDLQQRGASYLAIPATSMWWLDHYTEFGQFLSEHARVVYSDESIGKVFRLLKGGERTANVRA